MVVRSLRLENFRNYTAQELTLPSGLVAFTGDNGQGKTNLLEAVCVLATTKSPLVERDRELIRWNERAARLYAEIELPPPPNRSADVRRLEYSWRVDGAKVEREMKVGGISQAAVATWLGQLQVVSFFPHDLVLVAGEPEERRRFLNLELGKIWPSYFSDIAGYRRALQQRNAYIKSSLDNPKSRELEEKYGSLTELNRSLVSYGARVLAARNRFFHEIAPLLCTVHQRLSGLDGPFEIEYLPGLSAWKREEAGERVEWSRILLASLEADHRDDFRRASTQSGPHRDEFAFRLADVDLRRYGSQGQGRLAVLSLKIALAHWVRDTLGDDPILLLDDALSELDATRRGFLLGEARAFSQSIVTATDATFLGEVAAHYRVENGKVDSV